MFPRAFVLSLFATATAIGSSAGQTLDLTGNSFLERPSGTLLKTLARPVHFPGIEASETTLRTVLKELAERHDVVFDINEIAFKAEGVPNVLDFKIATKPIPPARNASLATVVQTVVARIPADSGATFIVRRDIIEVTTREFAVLEGWRLARENFLSMAYECRTLTFVIRGGFSLETNLYQMQQIGRRFGHLVYWSDVTYTNAHFLSAGGAVGKTLSGPRVGVSRLNAVLSGPPPPLLP